jgi:hypothetical protein
MSLPVYLLGYGLDNGVIFRSRRGQGFFLFVTLCRPPVSSSHLPTEWVPRLFLEGGAAGSRSWKLSKSLVTTIGSEPEASQIRSRDASDAISFNKVKNKNLIALCWYCTEIHTLIQHCLWLFYVVSVVTLGNTVPPTKSMAVIFWTSAQRSSYFRTQCIIKWFFGRSAVCLLSCTNWIFRYISGYSSFLKT